MTDAGDPVGRGGRSRREVLQYSAAGAAAVGLTAALAACGDDDGGSTGTQATPKAQIKPGGRLRVAVLGGGEIDTVDAQTTINEPSAARRAALYDGLTAHDHEFGIKPALAEELTPNDDATVWTVRIREGAEFHDGKPVTADDVMFTITRSLDPKFFNDSAPTWQYVDPKQMRKRDDRTVELTLTQPLAVFDDVVTGINSYIVPVDYDPEKPVGSGPFIYQSFTPGRESVFTKNPNYWGEAAYVDELVITDLADNQTAVNALLAGQIEAATSISPQQVSAIEGRGGKIVTNPGGQMRPLFSMNVEVDPFSELDVRQALKLVVDRDDMVSQVLPGIGAVGNDLYSVNDQYYDKSVPQRQVDIEQAKALLAKAGHSDLKIELSTSPLQQGVVETAQVFVEQAKAAGIAVELKQLDPGAFYGPDAYLKFPFSTSPWQGSSFVTFTLLYGLPTAFYSETHWNDPEYIDAIDQGLKELDLAKRTQHFHDAQRIFWERSGTIVPTLTHTLDAYAKGVVGPPVDKSAFPYGGFALSEIGFAA